jgi:hypothetical protein
MFMKGVSVRMALKKRMVSGWNTAFSMVREGSGDIPAILATGNEQHMLAGRFTFQSGSTDAGRTEAKASPSIHRCCLVLLRTPCIFP